MHIYLGVTIDQPVELKVLVVVAERIYELLRDLYFFTQRTKDMSECIYVRRVYEWECVFWEESESERYRP